VTEDIFRDNAWCYRHEAYCPLGYRDAKTGCFGDVSGTTCLDESSMGKGSKFLGDSAPAFAVWCTEVKYFYDFSLQEITPLFKPDVFSEILSEFDYQTIVALILLSLHCALCLGTRQVFYSLCDIGQF
jgi:hypothetical protein